MKWKDLLSFFPIKISSPSISSGLLHIDQKIGGYPIGELIEIVGKEGSGKTNLTLKSILANEIQGFTSLYIDINQQLNQLATQD